MQSPHLRIVFSEDAQEWDRYVTDCLSRCIQTNAANSQLNVHHEKLENITATAATFTSQNATDSSTTTVAVPTSASSSSSQVINILILSPGLLQLLHRRPSLGEHIRALGARVVCILCGVRRSDLLQKLYQSMATSTTQTLQQCRSTSSSDPTLRNALQWMHLWHMLDAEQQSDQLLPQLLLVIGRLLRQQQQSTSPTDTIRPTSSKSINVAGNFHSANIIPITPDNESSASLSIANQTTLEPEGEVYSLLSALTSGRPISETTAAFSFNPLPSCASSSCSSSGVSSVGSQLSNNESVDKPAFKLRPLKVTQVIYCR